MTTYTYQSASWEPNQLLAEIVALALPGFAYINGSGTQIDVWFSAALTPANEAILDAAIAAHVPAAPRQKRTLYAIWQQLNGLTNAQQTNIWTNLTAGSPPRWSQATGTNAAAIMALHWSATNSGATVTNLNDAKRRLTALYVQDNPKYLVNPSFDATINVPGDEVIP